MNNELQNEGLFVSTLKRNNAKIREDRAAVIAEDAELSFKRKVEDLQMDLKKLKRDRDNMLDLSPDSGDSLKVASDFKANEFVEKDLQLGLKIREVEIKLEVAEARYNELFTPKTN